MRLLVLGVNHKSAGVALREQIAISDEQQPEIFTLLCELHGCSEVAILSTCNRTELYVAGHHIVQDDMIKWLASYKNVDLTTLVATMYCAWDEEAVQHIMRVASGLDSLVLGEPQILGQLKSSYNRAKECSALGSYLERFFQVAFSVAKEVRTDTEIGINPVSVAFAAVDLSKRIFSDLSEVTALIIGAGETAELLAKHLNQSAVAQLLVANRTLDRARLLADRYGGEAFTLAQLSEALDRVDIVVSSTASQLPILGKGMVEASMKRRKHRPLLMLDLAVPRDIEPEVGAVQDIYLYSVDDLQEVVDQNRQQRLAAAQEAEKIIQRRSSGFMQQIRELDAVGTLTAFRQKVEEIRETELQAALHRLDRGESPQDVMARMSRAMINKLMHEPTVQIRKAGSEGQFDQLAWVRALFDLEMTAIEPEKQSNLRSIKKQALTASSRHRPGSRPPEH